ncbi:MAG: hypothetical protein IJ499_04065 [Clostridia bacterium]|nr:hypothetical protein [Clostridia bacterium]
MPKYKRKTICFGGTLAAIGCFIRALQLLLSYFGNGFASAKWLYITMLCLLCGGFAMMCYERKGKTSAFAIFAAVSGLMTSTMGNMSDGNDGLRIASAIFLLLTFVFGSLSVYTSSKNNNLRRIGAVATIVFALICEVAAFGVPVPPTITAVALLLAYITMGISLISI